MQRSEELSVFFLVDLEKRVHKLEEDMSWMIHDIKAALGDIPSVRSDKDEQMARSAALDAHSGGA